MQHSVSKDDAVARNDCLFDPDDLADCVPEGEDSYSIRPLMVTDFSRHYLSLLSQLTVVGDIDRPAFERKSVLQSSLGSSRTAVCRAVQ